MFRLSAVGFSSGTVQGGSGSLIEPSKLEQMRRNNTLTWHQNAGIPLKGTVIGGLYLEPFL